MKPSEFPEVKQYPAIKKILEKHVDMLFEDIRSMLKHPLHEFEGVRRVMDGVVYTVKGRYRARYVVGADGVNSTVARCLGLRWSPRDLYLLSCFDLDVQWPEDEIVIRVIPVLDTYFWVFPKREVTNVGLGVRLSDAGRIDVSEVTKKFIGEEVGPCRVVERWFAVLPLRARWRVVYGRAGIPTRRSTSSASRSSSPNKSSERLQCFG